MNQNLKIKRSIFALTLLVSLVFADSDALAQGNFAPLRSSNNEPANTSSLPSHWAPPVHPQSQYNVVPASGHQPVSNVPTSSSFPSEPYAFDPGIRTAKLDLPVTHGEISTDASIDSTLDSTASMLANFKTATGDKLSGFMATFKQEGGWSEKLKSITGSADIGKMLGSLALVLGIYFAFVWVMRKFNPNGNRGLPPEVIEVMGQVPFGVRGNLQLVRLGSKLLLLMNSPEGTQPIGEITDPSEVEYLASLCPGNRKKRSSVTGPNHQGSNHIAAIQQAARNLVSSNNATTNVGASASVAADNSPANTSNLASILRTLEQAAKPNGNVFEA